MSNKDIIVKDYDGNYLYPRAYKDYEGNVIHTTYVKGVKGNAETDYRTGNVNLTPANIGAVNKAGDTMTGNLRVVSAGEKYVEVKNSTTQANVLLDSNSTGIHGIWSGGYYTGSAYVTSSKWLLTRDTSGNVNLYGNADSATTATSATKATQDANGLDIANGYIKRSTAVFGESSGSGNTQGWWKVASGSFTTYGNTNLAWLVKDNYAKGTWGILVLEMRGNKGGAVISWGLRWLFRSNFSVGDFRVVSSGTSWTLYGYRNGNYGKISMIQLQQKDINGADLEQNSAGGVTYYNNTFYGTTSPGGDAAFDYGIVNSANNIMNKAGSYATLTNALLDMVYPVGSIYMSVNSTSPATFLGGTWTRITDTFLYAGASSGTYAPGNTGGSKTQTLQLKNYRKRLYIWNGASGGAGGTPVLNGDYIAYGQNYNCWLTDSDNEAFSIMPPYTTVYMWKRTA